jgi:hypothetical protein
VECRISLQNGLGNAVALFVLVLLGQALAAYHFLCRDHDTDDHLRQVVQRSPEHPFAHDLFRDLSRHHRLMPGIELTTVSALIPIVNISLATKEVLAGTIQTPC